MRAVVDPGVLIAAAISRTQGSATVELVRHWRRGRFDLVASDRLVAEFAAVAQRPWFRERVSSQQVDRLVADLRQRAVVAGGPENVWPVSRDPDDDYLVALARSTAADAGATRTGKSSRVHPSSMVRAARINQRTTGDRPRLKDVGRRKRTRWECGLTSARGSA